MPPSNRVSQTYIPETKYTIRTEQFDPRKPQMAQKEVFKNTTFFNGVNYEAEKLKAQGYPINFKQVNVQDIKDERNAGVTMARQAEKTSDQILKTAETSEMHVPIVMSNVREDTDVKLENDNTALEAKMKSQ
jgi:hypothetical protein